MQSLAEKGIFIQQLSVNDLDEVISIERISFKDPWTRIMFEREINSSTFFVLRQKETNTLSAYFGYWRILDELHIINLAVAPEYRGQGIGSLIVEHILDEAKKYGCKRVMLEVRSSNFIAQKLYFKFGFQTVGVRKRYYSDHEDALLLEKKI